MNITKEFDNKLLNRKEVEVTLESNGATISRADAKAQLVKKLKADEKLVVVNSIDSHFGSKEVKVEAYVYSDEDSLNKLTPAHIQKRNEAPAAEGAAE